MNPMPGTTPEGIRWAYALLQREVLGFDKGFDAKKACGIVAGKAAA